LLALLQFKRYPTIREVVGEPDLLGVSMYFYIIMAYINQPFSNICLFLCNFIYFLLLNLFR